jgi:hypothetical protein
MKFCYANEICDDRGETIQVMVGIVADAQRLNRSRVEFFYTTRIGMPAPLTRRRPGGPTSGLL